MRYFQNESVSARRNLPIKMVDATDGFTAEPALTVTVQIRKNGGTWTAGGGTVSEPGGSGNGLGSYVYQATQAELDTVGAFEYIATATGARAFNGLVQIEAQDPNVLLATASAASDIQARLPAALVFGRIDASVGSMAANTLTASALATDAVSEIQSGLATASGVSAVETDTQDIQSRLPAALVSGRIDASIGAMAANTMTASALATDAVTEIVSGVATQLATDHGAGSWEGSGGGGATAEEVAIAVWSRVIESGHDAEAILRLLAAFAFGRAYNLKSSQPVFRNLADTKNRIVAAISTDGNSRTIVTVDGE
jgi:hypothetical protein